MTAEERIAELEKQKEDLEGKIRKLNIENWELREELTKSKKEAENWRRMVTERNVRF